MQETEIKDNKYSIKYYPDTVISFEKKGNYFYFHSSETILEVRVLSDKIVRFRYAPTGYFKRDFSYAVRPTLKESLRFLRYEEEAAYFIIRTTFIKVFIDKSNLRVTIKDLEDNVINEDELGFHWQYYIQKGGKIVFCSKKIQKGESFFGMGDKPTHLNIREKRFENYGRDSYGFLTGDDPLYKNIPFYYGLHHGKGYGIFFDNTFRTIFDFGKERDDVCSFWARGGQMNYYFIYGPQLLDVAKQYTGLTGTPDLPPLWALGYQQSCWSYYPESKVRQIASEFRKRSIPCDVIHLDIDYMDGFRCFTWDKDRFPDPRKMNDDLLEDGFKTIAIIDPGIKADPDYWIYKEGLENDYFCKRADGALMEGDVWPGRCVFPDFTNPKVREWWKDLFGSLVDSGVSAVWNDMNEPAVFGLGTFPEDVRHNYDGAHCSHRKAHNVYGHLMSKATADGMKKHMMPRRTFAITRSCYAGAQRWTSVWTGDNIATWEHLWLASVMCQRLSISGISFAGSDIGGFIDEPDGELYVRWLQLGVFNTFMRTHSASNETGFNQDPWSFGKKYERLARKFINLRYQLLPYHYTAFWQYASKGIPMLKPLSFVEQENPDTYYRDEEFLFGDHLLVSAVSKSKQSRKKIYLPKGKWYYYWSEELILGGREFEVETPLEEMPLFVRAGAVLPKYPIMQYVGEKTIENMPLHLYFAEGQTRSEFYEDAGDFYGYLENERNEIRWLLEGKKDELRLSKNCVEGYEPSYDRFEVYVHGLNFEPKEILVDGVSQGMPSYRHDELFSFEVERDFKEIVIR